MGAVLGLLIGVIFGLTTHINIPAQFAPYISVAILACLDSVFGALRAKLSNNFQGDIFISGFFGNAILAVALAYLGDRFGIPMYLAAVIILGGRVFNNFAIIRRLMIEKLRSR